MSDQQPDQEGRFAHHSAAGAGRTGSMELRQGDLGSHGLGGRDLGSRRLLALQLQRLAGNRGTVQALGLGQGKPLDSGLRSTAEHAYATDLADVTIHTDEQAASLVGSNSAKAVTFGRSIAFGSGQFQPGSFDSDVVLAHELAHVAQQSDNTGAGVDPAPESLESDADRSAALGVAALRGDSKTAGSAAPSLRSSLQVRRCGGSSPPPPTPFLTVTGATRFATDAYVTINGSAVSVAITGLPAGTAVPPGSVTWTGGDPGPDQLHRLLPTATAGTTTITASGGGKSGSVTIHVVLATAPPATNTPAILRPILLGTPAVVTPPALGLTVVTIGQQGITGPEFDLTAHLDGATWRYRVSEIRHSYKVGINGGTLIPISGPGDPAITPDTIGPIITAFTPRSASTPPPTQPYWSPTIVRAHEEAHVTRFFNSFWNPRMQTLESEIEATSLPFDSGSAATAVAAIARLRPTWQARADALHRAADAAEIPASETSAHTASNLLWVALINSIRDTVAPPAPTALTGTTAAGSTTLNWTPRNLVNTNGFVIQRRVGGGAFVDIGTVAAGVRSHIDPSTPAAGTVTYRVLAVGVAGRSAASPVHAVTRAP